MATFFKKEGKNVELRYKLPEQYTHLQEFCVLGFGKTQKEATFCFESRLQASGKTFEELLLRITDRLDFKLAVAKVVLPVWSDSFAGGLVLSHGSLEIIKELFNRVINGTGCFVVVSNVNFLEGGLDSIRITRSLHEQFPKDDYYLDDTRSLHSYFFRFIKGVWNDSGLVYQLINNDVNNYHAIETEVTLRLIKLMISVVKQNILLLEGNNE